MSEQRSLGEAIGAYLRAMGHEEVSLLGEVARCWEDVVGPKVAEHASPAGFVGGDLVVAVDDPGWATQLGFLAETILGGLEAELGRPVALGLKVTVRR